MHRYGWDSVASYNRAGEKVGRGVGELVGIEPLGVVMTAREPTTVQAAQYGLAESGIRQTFADFEAFDDELEATWGY